MTIKHAGRPRQFERERALRAAVDLFWHQGYAATSLDDLLNVMQIAKSSFYSSFGSKHALFLEGLALYTEELYARMEAAALTQDDPERAVRSVIDIAACTEEPRSGCFFINSAMELLPSDTAVSELGRRHLGRVDKLIGTLLCRCGLSEAEARQRGGALLAMAAGAVVLRKAGEPPARIEALLELTPVLIKPQS